MIRMTAVVSLALLFVAGSALAAPDKKPAAKKPAKQIQVTTCPIAGDDSKGSAITEKVDNYVVHFCCPSCKPAFDKLSKKDKLSKIQTALKGATKKSTKVQASLTSINVCPITGEKVEGDGGGSSVVGKYEVHFCCAGCKPAFDKMTAAEKEAKIQELLKKS